MSGGHFDYQQYHIGNMADSIQEELDYQTHPDEIQSEMRKAIRLLREAEIYVHRIDWYLSGDDGEESFLSRLREELEKI